MLTKRVMPGEASHSGEFVRRISSQEGDERIRSKYSALDLLIDWPGEAFNSSFNALA
jgi:hypothetical protein